MSTELQKSFASASDVAERYPQYADQIVAAAKSSFLAGESTAIAVCVLVVLAGAVLVFCCFPRRAQEEQLLASYAAMDAAAGGSASSVGSPGGQSRSTSG